jgi:hypothetical protein
MTIHQTYNPLFAPVIYYSGKIPNKCNALCNLFKLAFEQPSLAKCGPLVNFNLVIGHLS